MLLITMTEMDALSEDLRLTCSLLGTLENTQEYDRFLCFPNGLKSALTSLHPYLLLADPRTQQVHTLPPRKSSPSLKHELSLILRKYICDY